MRNNGWHRSIAAAILAAASTGALAVDGTVLIDQTRALAGGVTPGDAAGFPVTISRPGSYRLASNLVVSDANTNAIEIAANTPGVTIDLNGFAIMGPTVCSGFPLTCTPAGSGSGVADLTGTSRGTVVRNGTITGMAANGIILTSGGGVAEDLMIRGNGGNGVLMQLSTINRNRIMSNGQFGISGGNAVITLNVVVGNRLSGIDVNDSLVTQNTINVNGGLGLAASNTGFANNNFSSNNGGFFNPQFQGRTPIGPNSCDGNVCP